MKELYKIGAYLAVLALAAGLWVLFAPVASERQTASFLDAVVDQKYDEAALLYGGLSADGSAGRWAGELRRIYEEDGFHLHAYEGLQAEYDDGCFCHGHVNLIFDVQGETIPVRAILVFGEEYKPRQVCAIPHPEQKTVPGLNAWNRLVACGGFARG
ncbi:hypothetical protein [Paenibacillus mucilaginosus]|uniref:Uncharacterized protein n=2 Tax=Paenibacillus mucilaginosus TaxID=61624 RepID=H6NJV5_9BACL|nr:hypothetical protein [Paenibacillus mucilaginosus]AFC30259.1 hypothetical protein PM3016_3418 [Paenibacillus mucilaginosus 3016]MCG7214443.1 hypothetical protein [Paenibacillus mucilaginosus]WDM30727.1 hypothetical protein KCX80_16890 [Paenibacillus mucilaginosus]WFA18904.1 hypothetical protein ERY13_17270 [Paenibacillus mucilaginosus]